MDPQSPETWPSGYELEWTAPTECPSSHIIEVRVMNLLGGPPLGRAGRAHVRGRVDRVEPGYRLVVESKVGNATESHELSANDCDILADSVVLLVASVLQPTLRTESPLIPPPIIDAPASAATKEPSLPPTIDAQAVEELPVTASSWRAAPDRSLPLRSVTRPQVAVGLSVGLEAGSFRVPAIAFAGALGPVWRRVRLEGTVDGSIPRRVRSNGFEARLTLWTLGARTCWRWVRDAFEVPLCLGFEAGMVHAQSRQVAPPQSRASGWMGPRAGTGLIWQRRGFGIRASVDATVRLIGPEFFVDGQSFFDSWPISLRASVGIFIQSPRKSRNADTG